MNRAPVALIVIIAVAVLGVVVYSVLAGSGHHGPDCHRTGTPHAAPTDDTQHQAHDHAAQAPQRSTPGRDDHDHGAHCPHCPGHDHDHGHDHGDGHAPDHQRRPDHTHEDAHEHDPGEHAHGRPATQDAAHGLDEAIRLRAVALSAMQVKATDPQVLLALGEQLQLTPAQQESLSTLAARTRREAAQILSPEQHQALRALGEQPFGMTQLCETMMRRAHGEDHGPDHDGRAIMNDCPIMQKAHGDDRQPSSRPHEGQGPHSEHAH